MSLLAELHDESNVDLQEAIRVKVRTALRLGWSMSRIGFVLANSPGFVHRLFNERHAFNRSTLAVVYSRLDRLDQPIPKRRSATERYL